MPSWQPERVSFDVFFQRFKDGEAEAGGSEVMRRILAPFIVSEEPDRRFARVEVGDGGGDAYLHDDGMMANHVTGHRAWDLLVEGALAAGFVILPAGCPTCITDEAQRRHLPEGLDRDVVLVLNGADLVKVIQSA